MNYIGKVAEMLGVEIGEEFCIKDEGGFYKLTESGISGRGIFGTPGSLHTLSDVLECLLTGELEIILVYLK